MMEALLTHLKMRGALEALPSLQDTYHKSSWDPTLALLRAEEVHRESQATQRRLLQAKFPMDKEWSEIDKTLNPEIDFTTIESLNKEDLLKQHHNLCIMGQQGTGKTHCLIALGRKLCRQGASVKFFTACSLVNALEEAKTHHTLSKFMQKLVKPQLLIIDELGFIPFSTKGARLLFDVFASRYEKGSIAVSTNLSFDKWIQIFGSVELSAALIDRFTHKCLIYNFSGKSVRLMDAQARRRQIDR